MSNKNPEEKCMNCIHFITKPGECRKYAPRRGSGNTWAHVQAQDWCSEFEYNNPEGEPTDQNHTA